MSKYKKKLYTMSQKYPLLHYRPVYNNKRVILSDIILFFISSIHLASKEKN